MGTWKRHYPVNNKQGVKKFLLDTGATLSVYRESDSQSSDSIRFRMNIEGYDFGGWDFLPYPITSDLASELDGVLGIDFFKTHVICFDFQEKYLYIHKTKINSSTMQSCKNFFSVFFP